MCEVAGSQDGPLATYSVTGFVHFANGHFIAFVRRSMKWLKCDDSIVTEMDAVTAIWLQIIFVENCRDNNCIARWMCRVLQICCHCNVCRTCWRKF